jgi:AraC-like DNA-binding protein
LTTIEGNKIVQGMTYNSDNISELEEYFTKEQKYTKIKSDGRKIRFKKTMNQNDVMTRKDGTKVNEHVIELVYSNASTFLNNSAEFFAKFGMTINHDSKNNEVIVHSKAQLEAFTLAVGLG